MKRQQHSDAGDTPVQIVYDKTTGEVLATHRSFSLEEGKFREVPSEEVLETYRDEQSVVARVAGRNAENLAVLNTTMSSLASAAAPRVSARRQAVVAKAHIRLRTDRDALEGDGQDSVNISIDVVDEGGQVMRDFQGELKVTTSRGKLSARGGRVQIERGQGTVTLTSVRETVERVSVRASAAGLATDSDELVLSFE